MSTGETAAWLEALYGRCKPGDGEVFFIDPSKRKTYGSVVAGSKDELLSAARALEGRLGYYAKINLMDGDAIRERSRLEKKGRFITGNRSEVKTIVSFHLDCDAGKSSQYHSREHMLRILDQMPRRPSLIVNSDGPDGGFHCYWLLREPIRIRDDESRQYLQRLATRWQKKLNELAQGKLDSTANIDRVLRVVGQGRIRHRCPPLGTGSGRCRIGQKTVPTSNPATCDG